MSYSFPCLGCGEYYSFGGETFLYNSDYQHHDGPLCKKCISSLPISEEEKKMMLEDYFDWNFCGQYLSERIKQLLLQLKLNSLKKLTKGKINIQKKICKGKGKINIGKKMKKKLTSKKIKN